MCNEKLISELIERFDLNLEGLNIYTEAASGHYAYTPILAAVAGARRVTAQVNDSKYGLASDIAAATVKLAEIYQVDGAINCVTNRNHKQLSRADIITNSGHVRPIDFELIDALKPTAVIPLMWETWEYREEDFDLKHCKEKAILVLGTKEQDGPSDMRRFIGLTGLKLLLNLSFDGGKVLVMGNSSIPGETVVNYFRKSEIDVTWISDDSSGDYNYLEASAHFEEHGAEYSHIILAEHSNNSLLLGKGGVISFDYLKAVNPSLRIGVMCGNIDRGELVESGLEFLPESILPFGYISYQPFMLGPRPILTLYAAGLKVGMQMAKARLRGLSTRQSAMETLKTSPGMDFENNFSWIKS